MELSPDWVVGFVDGEGCFHVSLNPHTEMSTGYQVLPEFVVVQHERDKQVLQALKRFFGAGIVRSNHGDRWCLRIRKLEALRRVCDFFLQHPLKTKKNVDFFKFRRIVLQMEMKRHLRREGLLEIIDILLSMNSTQLPRVGENTARSDPVWIKRWSTPAGNSGRLRERSSLSGKFRPA